MTPAPPSTLHRAPIDPAPYGSLTATVSTEETTEHHPAMSRNRAVTIISCITCITGIGNLHAGLLTTVIAPNLQLWPAAAFALACGCTLLPCGAAADVLGCRRACLLGALLQAACALGAGLAATAPQLIALRGAAGIAVSFCLPSAVGVTAHSFPASSRPRLRNVAFAAMGGGPVVEFGLGLVLGGVCADTVGWRWGLRSGLCIGRCDFLGVEGCWEVGGQEE